ncbi:N-acetylmuramoyl-L-alanine amidase family protein [Bacillus sp. S3]|nr:N-acetylmuramoyl-L-alanine amidase family protein [Bacillus sp. S3]
MDSSSWSDIGFILEDASGNLIYPEDMIVDDHEMSQLHNLAAGVYYIKALNIGEMVTNDLYALAWDYFEPSTPQDTTPPAAPTIDRVDTNTTIITGTAEPGSTVEVEATGATGFHAMTVADSKGKYYLNIDYPLPVGARITVTAVDAAGNRSVTSYTTVVNVPVKNGWVSENNKWYFYVNGNKKIGWLKQGTTWYFLSYQTGTMATGWIFDGGKWYYLQPSGAMKTGWLFDGGKWYYLASSGDMKTGWLFDGGSWYYLANSGAMQTGWVLSNGKWYYLYSNGKMAHSTKIGTYKLGRDGAWIR